MKFSINLSNIKTKINNLGVDKSIIIALTFILLTVFIISFVLRPGADNVESREIIKETDYYKIERNRGSGKYYVEAIPNENLPIDLTTEIEEYLLSIMTQDDIDNNVTWDIPGILMGGKPENDFESKEEYEKYMEDANFRYEEFNNQSEHSE